MIMVPGPLIGFKTQSFPKIPRVMKMPITPALPSDIPFPGPRNKPPV